MLKLALNLSPKCLTPTLLHINDCSSYCNSSLLIRKLNFTEQSKSLSEDTEHSLKPDYEGFTIHNGIEPLGVQELQLLPDGIEEKDVDIQREEEISLDNEDSGSSEMNAGKSNIITPLF